MTARQSTFTAPPGGPKAWPTCPTCGKAATHATPSKPLGTWLHSPILYRCRTHRRFGDVALIRPKGK